MPRDLCFAAACFRNTCCLTGNGCRHHHPVPDTCRPFASARSRGSGSIIRDMERDCLWHNTVIVCHEIAVVSSIRLWFSRECGTRLCFCRNGMSPVVSQDHDSLRHKITLISVTILWLSSLSQSHDCLCDMVVFFYVSQDHDCVVRHMVIVVSCTWSWLFLARDHPCLWLKIMIVSVTEFWKPCITTGSRGLYTF